MKEAKMAATSFRKFYIKTGNLDFYDDWKSLKVTTNEVLGLKEGAILALEDSFYEGLVREVSSIIKTNKELSEKLIKCKEQRNFYIKNACDSYLDDSALTIIENDSELESLIK